MHEFTKALIAFAGVNAYVLLAYGVSYTAKTLDRNVCYLRDEVDRLRAEIYKLQSERSSGK